MTKVAILSACVALMYALAPRPVTAQLYTCWECSSVETPDPTGPYDWTITFGDSCAGGGSEAQLASRVQRSDDPGACKRCYGSSEYCGEGITFGSPLDYCEEASDCGLSESELRQALLAAELGDVEEFTMLMAGHNYFVSAEGVAFLGCRGEVTTVARVSDRVLSLLASASIQE